MIHSVWVPGDPVPQGSMSAYPYERAEQDGSKSLHVSVSHSREKDLRAWREAIGWTWKGETGGARWEGGEPLFGALMFVLPLASSVPRDYPTMQSDGDLDKYARGAYDALEHVAYENDSRVVLQLHRKVYRLPKRGVTGVHVTLCDLVDVSTDLLHGIFRGLVRGL